MDFAALAAATEELHGLDSAEDPRVVDAAKRKIYGIAVGAVAQVLRSGKTKAGADSVALLASGAPYFALSKAQLFQDIWAQHELGWKRDGFFVEFGAADGEHFSNSWMLEKHFGWTGIIAEPNPDFHEALRANRDCTLLFECIYSTSGLSVPFRRHTVGEFSRVWLEPASEAHRIVQVPTITLNDALKANGAPRVIDFMSIDTEGSELDILEGFDFDAWDVRTLCVEHNMTPARDQISKLLKSHGYKRRFAEISRFDDWYVRRT